MARKPTYEELEQRVKELEKEAAKHRQAQESLRESEERLKAVLDTIQAGIVVIDPETHVIVGVNSAAAKMVGAQGRQILGSQCHGYICPAEERRCPVTDLGQSFDTAEAILLTANGESVPILKTVGSVILAGREHLLESFLDITEQKQAEKELRESEKRVYENQKRMGILKFANDVALELMHELRTPLVPIGGYSRRISSREYPEDKLRKYASIIFEQSMRLDNALDEALVHLKDAAEQV